MGGRVSCWLLLTLSLKGVLADSRCITSRYVFHSAGILPHPSYQNRVEYLQPGTKNCSLRISDLRKSDSGAYVFYLITSHRTQKMPEQKGVQLLVADSSSAVMVSASPSSDITEGVALRLACGSPAASPQALFRWYKSASSTPRHTGQVWDISEVTPGDSGSYYCQIQTGDIEQNSTMLPIDVESDKSFHRARKSPATPTGRGPTLSSANISAEEYGLHCCEARNRHGSQTDSVKLTDPKAPNPAALRYLTRPADLTVAVGDLAVFSCGVPRASPTFTFTFYGSHGNYSLTCPSGHVEDIPQALYGSCGSKKGELLAVWTLKGTSYSDNGTRVVCQQPNNPAAPAAVLHVYDDGRSYSILIGCVIGGFFGILLVFGLSYLMLRRSETLQTWFRGSQPEDDMNTIVTKE
ncbi:Basement membrane-specific heparan sulfate proteoglycan core protein [Dissostichus eleginoides]|uniref:B-cell receptor CD22 n=1 Tax=Dissostichus eleginoides TaxID=100907 RepID=A0AAD9C4V5_DISEL|nr:Basement membrane-specific heparan sulfate proteoglycan core protein [Dissostichus eleginoides]